MKEKPALENLEAELGRSLTAALPPVQAPPDMVERIRRRLPMSQSFQQTTKARILHFPRRRTPTPTRRPLLRWVGAAVVVALLVSAGGPSLERAGHRWFGPQASFPIAAPFPLAGFASAAGPVTPALERQLSANLHYRLTVPLPVLPATGVVQSVHVPADSAWLKTVKLALGITAPIKTEWDKVPVLTPKTGHRAGPLSLPLTGVWWYDAHGNSGPVPAAPAAPQSDLAQARAVAEAWLKQGQIYPSGPLEVTVQQDAGGMAEIGFYPAAGSPLATGGDFPGILVGVRNGRVETARGLWPDQVADLASVPLRSVDEAWADLQAGIGVVNPNRPEMVEAAPDPTMTIREVRLDRALVRSLDDRWYFIPVVLFRGDITGVDGKPHEQFVYVSAIKAQPGQGGYELKATLPAGPTAAPALHVTNPTAETVTFQSYRPAPPPKMFAVPSDANVTDAARRIVGASQFAGQELGEPELLRGVLGLAAIFPILSAGLPIIQSNGTPSFARQVSVDFRLPHSVQSISLFTFPADPVGEPFPLLTAAEAWERLRTGAGRVKIMNTAQEFPNAQFAANRTVIDRATLAYDMDRSVSLGNALIEPAWFFYGTAEVGEEHQAVKVVVIVPARR